MSLWVLVQVLPYKLLTRFRLEIFGDVAFRLADQPQVMMVNILNIPIIKEDKISGMKNKIVKQNGFW
jgi:hypothetical protein